jgi:hypothetical protein
MMVVCDKLNRVLECLVTQLWYCPKKITRGTRAKLKHRGIATPVVQ